jgi:hypothetical protein
VAQGVDPEFKPSTTKKKKNSFTRDHRYYAETRKRKGHIKHHKKCKDIPLLWTRRGITVKKFILPKTI